jgi:Hemerythrin HHE cation binding domain
MTITHAPATSRFVRSGAESAPIMDVRSPRTLADEHSLLLRDVQRLTARVLERLLEHASPAAELQTLVRYLRTTLLRHTSDEEVLLFPRGASLPFAELSADHVRFYSLTEQLAAYDWYCSPTQLRELVEDLVATLERHQHLERALLAALPGAPKDTPGVASLAIDARQWLSMSDESVVIDLDVLPESRRTQLCIERLLRLGPTEAAEVFSCSDAALRRVFEWMRAFDLVRYELSLTESEQGPSRLQVTRRSIT